MNASPGGIYTGTLNTGTVSDDLLGIVGENGDGFFYDNTNGAIYRMKVTTMGNALSGTFRGFAPSGSVFATGSSVETGTISGTDVQRSGITGTASTSAGSSSFSVQYVASHYEQAASLSAVAGKYVYTFSNGPTTDTVTFTVSSTGVITGSDTQNCSVSGSLSPINAAYNAYSVAVHSSCPGPINTSYTGIAAYEPAQSGNAPILTFEYDDGSTVALVRQINKQP